ncbi:MNIO family bufferin maturase [Hyphobacterium marinum]|uniref:UPF0276 protein V0U35_02415 n=1 Tax=Hyphobacterium marinum TaxID=3116574 RepID=A0ABU7LVD2_9PROT|nr:DUF692 domain-containing protein [Hyphobacterium sp. Y6023]MEE2565521.1 DUF692 domain-containing protein [Hyphobacterium sp. Y6023]
MGAGIGLKAAHYRAALEARDAGLWVEVHPENYMSEGGPRLAWLDAIAAEHPLSLHGVGLSLGGTERPDRDHLKRLKALADRYAPALMSEHLAWCAHDGVYFGDLLPVLYTSDALDRFCAHVDETQEALGRTILIENPSHYLNLTAEMAETDFLAETVRRTGCGLLLDVNNVHVSANNMGYDARAYLDALNLSAVGEIHLAGHTPDATHGEALLIDSHDAPVRDDVWDLYDHVLGLTGPVPTLIERDSNLPDFAELMAERDQAQACLDLAASRSRDHA